MVLKCILDLQQNVEAQLYRVPELTLFEALATGELDVGISAWLPNTHQHFFDKYSYTIQRHSVICDSLGLYMVVPAYAEVRTIADLAHIGDLINNTILIPESQNAIYHLAKNVLTDNNLSNFTLRESTWDNIVSFMNESLENNAYFAFIGLRPHWIFQRHDIKALEDRRGSLGQFEQAYVTLSSEFPNRAPTITRFLSSVRFTINDIETIMEMNQTLGTEPYENALKWINQNTSKVNRWLLGI
jgi:glycine betaine/proline transport system substrate-binding protein